MTLMYSQSGQNCSNTVWIILKCTVLEFHIWEGKVILYFAKDNFEEGARRPRPGAGGGHGLRGLPVITDLKFDFEFAGRLFVICNM